MPSDEELAARFGDAFPLILADERRAYRSVNQMDHEKRQIRHLKLIQLRTNGLKLVAAGAVAIFSLIRLRT